MRVTPQGVGPIDALPPRGSVWAPLIEVAKRAS